MTLPHALHRKLSPRALTLAALCLTTAIACAQTLPNAPNPPTKVPSQVGSYTWFGQVGLVCGAGASYATPATTPTVQCGGLMIMPFIEYETGVMGPQAAQSSVSGYLTVNAWLPLGPLGNKHGAPIISGGYTRMFETGSALDYGIGYAYPLDPSHSLRLEARDYWTYSGSSQHNTLLRLAWLVGLPD